MLVIHGDAKLDQRRSSGLGGDHGEAGHEPLVDAPKGLSIAALAARSQHYAVVGGFQVPLGHLVNEHLGLQPRLKLPGPVAANNVAVEEPHVGLSPYRLP